MIKVRVPPGLEHGKEIYKSAESKGCTVEWGSALNDGYIRVACAAGSVDLEAEKDYVFMTDNVSRSELAQLLSLNCVLVRTADELVDHLLRFFGHEAHEQPLKRRKTDREQPQFIHAESLPDLESIIKLLTWQTEGLDEAIVETLCAAIRKDGPSALPPNLLTILSRDYYLE